jgi:hypothetical protein
VQLAHLKQQPLYLFTIFWEQLKDTFGDNLMRGAWRGIFGAFGWSGLKLPEVANYLLVGGFAVAFAADAFGPLRPARTEGNRIAWAAAIGGVITTFPVTVIGMFLWFTRPHEKPVIGVQGRYYISSLFVLIAIALWKLRITPRERLQQLSRTWAPWLIAAICFASTACALEVMYHYFWV